jgi:hypothetical protein
MTYLDEILKDWLNTLKAERDRANAALDRARPYAGSPIQIDPALIEQFGRTMRENFTTCPYSKLRKPRNLGVFPAFRVLSRDTRPIHPPTAGKIIAFPQVGGLHHRYERRAA